MKPASAQSGNAGKERPKADTAITEGNSGIASGTNPSNPYPGCTGCSPCTNVNVSNPQQQASGSQNYYSYSLPAPLRPLSPEAQAFIASLAQGFAEEGPGAADVAGFLIESLKDYLESSDREAEQIKQREKCRERVAVYLKGGPLYPAECAGTVLPPD
jgi:hypothetical protein